MKPSALFCIAMTALLSAISPAAAQATHDHGASGISPRPLLTQVARWSESPSPEALQAAYPRAAPAGGGVVNLECAVKPDGRLAACRVSAELPAGAGFGEAALTLMPRFRVEALEVQDHPPVRPTVSFSLTLKRHGDQVPTPCLPPSCVQHP